METTTLLRLHARDATIIDLLRTRAEREPHRKAFGFVTDEQAVLADGMKADVESDISYAALDRKARAIAYVLSANGLEGQPVVLLFPPGLDYIAAVYGCFYAGAYAVPAYPPEPARLSRSLPRLVAMVVDSRARAVLTTGALCAMRETLIELAPPLAGPTFIATDAIDDSASTSWRAPARSPNDIAFLQYTSGSTGHPKGVVLTHQNLLHNMAAIRDHAQLTPDMVGVSWLPPYHDMGLIGFILTPVFCGLSVVHMSPLRFLADPYAWLAAITRHAAVISAAPNFAFDVCARRISESQKAHLDLRSWKMALSGAEPVRATTLERFARAFERCGFAPSSFRPVYGLAESSLLVSFPRAVEPPRLLRVDAHALRQDRVEVTDAESSVVLVGCGATVAGQHIVVVDPETRAPLGSERVGEIWLNSPSVARGYWLNAAESESTFNAALDLARVDDSLPRGPWARTGDLGFMHEGELFITGRLKDLIVIQGRNHYPQDIELTVERSHPLIRPGCTAAFTSDDAAFAEDERLVVVAELDQKRAVGTDHARVEDEIRHAISREHGVYVHVVVLVAQGSVSKTSSGKIQRRECRSLWRKGTLDVIETPEPWVTSLRLKPPEMTQARLTSLPPEARGPALVAHLRSLVSTMLSLSEDEVPADRPLYSFGLDSMAAVRLKAEIETLTGRTMPLASALEGPSIEAIVRSVSSPLDASNHASLAIGDGRRAPGPVGDALIGSLGALQADPFGFLLTMRRRYGEVVRMRLGPWEAHLVTQPEHVQRVLKDDPSSFVKASNYANQSVLTGEGLITAEGDEWRAQRDAALGAFHGRALARFSRDVLPSVVDDTMRELDARVGCAVNVSSLTKRLTLRAIALSLFGHDIKERLDEVLAALDAVADFGWDDMTAFLAGSTRKREEKLRCHMNVIDEVLFTLIDAGAPHGTLLAVLADDCRARFGREWRRPLRDQMLTYLLAGHDTTASALAFALLALADHPRVDELVAAEACSLARLQDAPVSALPFTQATAREVLRLWPPAWLFTRQASKDVDFGEWRVKSGSLVMLSPFVTHRDPFLWPNPNAFEPERFLSRSTDLGVTAESKPDGFAYFPFGGGPRSCIGAGFALAEMRFVLCALARRFRFTRPGGASREIALTSRVTLTPDASSLLVVERRRASTGAMPSGVRARGRRP